MFHKHWLQGTNYTKIILHDCHCFGRKPEQHQLYFNLQFRETRATWIVTFKRVIYMHPLKQKYHKEVFAYLPSWDAFTINQGNSPFQKVQHCITSMFLIADFPFSNLEEFSDPILPKILNLREYRKLSKHCWRTNTLLGKQEANISHQREHWLSGGPGRKGLQDILFQRLNRCVHGFCFIKRRFSG